ncbi:uncharacterized protein LOC113210632 isoform X1 [Frankliniella occidentalis]|uniref:Uncharacterized protein LOC113210632 isoform X1 n=1 Tax=Frankliniella occidentalis TaxID=133901 RepID=A0A9C6X7W7_FRAOC|nr:uncharacterized protein LOC113210632 isoform X1 [Frankliniella occidentalis]
MRQVSDAKQTSKSSERAPSSRNHMKIVEENGRKQNLKSILNDESLEQSASSSDELGDEFTMSTVQRLKRKCADQAEEIKELNAALQRAEEHCSNLVRLNNMWQEKELNRKKSGSSSSSKHKSEERFHPYKKSSSLREKWGRTTQMKRRI